MNKLVSALSFTLASAVRDLCYYREKLLAIRNNSELDLEEIGDKLDVLIGELSCSVRTFSNDLI